MVLLTLPTSHLAYILYHFVYITKSSVYMTKSFNYQLLRHIQGSWQIVYQANCGVFEPLHHRPNPSVFLRTPLLARAAASCSQLQDSHVSADLFLLEGTYQFERLGCDFPTILFRRLCQPSRWLLVVCVVNQSQSCALKAILSYVHM